MSLLKIENMSHHFGGLTAVAEFHESIEPGEIVGLIGPNGAGKTTVFNLVSGFYTPSAGAIRFEGRRISGLKPHRVTSHGIARTFQNIRLWHDMTVLDNIMISQHYSLGYHLRDLFLRTLHYKKREEKIRAEAYKLLEIFGLKDQAHERPKNLPYGIQRKVEIARALSIKPRILLLDEPAAGLNTNDVSELIKLINWIHKEFNLTIWMIEHQMTVIMTLCQRIKVIDFGRLIAQGTPRQIQNDQAVIKAYLGDGKI